MITPIRDKVLIEVVPPREQTEGGLYIPVTVNLRHEEAKVLAVGPGRYSDYGQFISTIVEVGDTVLIQRNDGEELSKNQRLISESRILAVIND